MKLKIFSCHHTVPDFELATPLYQTFVSGVTLPEGSVAMTDAAGQNIARLHKFSELRHQYFIWRNHLANYDYVGFEHYRRPFYLDPLPAAALRQDYPKLERIRQVLSGTMHRQSITVDRAELLSYNLLRRDLDAAGQRRIETFVAAHDILFAHFVLEDVAENFLRPHHNAGMVWEKFLAAVAATWQTTYTRRHAAMPMPWSGYLNTYIMRSELFHEYMGIMFSVLLDLDRKYPEAPGRIWGNMSERLLGAFIVQKMQDQPHLRCKTIPYLFFNES